MAWIQTPVPYSLLEVFRALNASLDDVFWLDSTEDIVRNDTAQPEGETDAATAANETRDNGHRSMLTLELVRLAKMSAAGELRFDRSVDDLAPDASPWSRLDAVVHAFRAREPNCPAGLVAWMSYSCGFVSPTGAPTVAHPNAIPMMELFETRAALVQAAGTVRLVTRASTEADARALTEQWLARLAAAVESGRGAKASPPDLFPLERVARGSKSDYLEGIARIQQHIADGAVEQVCLTYPISFSRPAAMSDWYVHLRERSPASYCSFVRTSALECASTSPECLFEIDGRTIRTRPMKGTRRRGALPDAELAQELKHNPKDRAENAMISSLVLRDLEKVCERGSAKIREAFTVETYATVLQMTSTVEGQLRQEVGPFAAFSALAPPASMTGTPRRRACEILDALESAPRGLYSGSIAWIDGGSRAQFSVVIRAMQAWEDHAAWHVGGGIIAESVPEDEWTESRTKALALFPDGASD